MTLRNCRRCASPFDGYGKARYCSEACRCGTDDGYWSGCRCEGCTRAHTRHRKLNRLYPRPWVPVLGSQRRVEALMCLGWSRAELSRRLGRSRTYLDKAFLHPMLEATTALLIAELYDDLSMTLCDARTAGRTASQARARGYAPPLAWDDAQLDNPNAKPHKPARDHTCDPVVIDRILSGEWSLPSTPAEKSAVIARWRSEGKSLTALERLTGWKAVRYYDPESEVA